MISNTICWGIPLKNINNITLALQSGSSDKNLVKPQNIAIFGSNMHKKTQHGAMPKMKNIFFFRNILWNQVTLIGHDSSENFFFLYMIIAYSFLNFNFEVM